MSEAATRAALPLLAWARIWSPVAPDDLREEAWSALDLPGTHADLSTQLWSTFHVGSPLPRVPLTLHAALHREGGETREAWMRAARHLGLEWNDVQLAPDHLGAACEIYAVAIASEEPVLVAELRRRYLAPWCKVAKARLAEETTELAALVGRFEADLRAA